MSFDTITPRVIIIEDNSFGEDYQVKHFMESVSYKRFKRTGCNDWYARKDDEFVTSSQVIITEVAIYSAFIWRKFKSFVKRMIGR